VRKSNLHGNEDPHVRRYAPNVTAWQIPVGIFSWKLEEENSYTRSGKTAERNPHWIVKHRDGVRSAYGVRLTRKVVECLPLASRRRQSARRGPDDLRCPDSFPGVQRQLPVRAPLTHRRRSPAVRCPEPQAGIPDIRQRLRHGRIEPAQRIAAAIPMVSLVAGCTDLSQREVPNPFSQTETDSAAHITVPFRG